MLTIFSSTYRVGAIDSLTVINVSSPFILKCFLDSQRWSKYTADEPCDFVRVFSNYALEPVNEHGGFVGARL